MPPDISERSENWLRDVLAAIRTVSIAAKEHDDSLEGVGYYEYRRNALYETKDRALAEIATEAAAVEQHSKGGRKTICLYFVDTNSDQWAFHVPTDKLPLEQLDSRQRVRDMEHRQNPSTDLSVREALTRLHRELGINANEFVKKEHVWDGTERLTVTWSCLPDAEQSSDSDGTGTPAASASDTDDDTTTTE